MIPIADDTPSRIVPIVTWLLLATCVVVFFWQVSLPAPDQMAVVHALGVIPAVLFGEAYLPPEIQLVPAWLTVFTSMFLHGGWLHLISNMLYLWVFADNVEDAMGHGRFLLFYLLCGVAAALAQSLPAMDSAIPMIGASGAISGVLGAYLLLYPWARITVIVPLGIILYPMQVPAFVMLLAWFGLQLVSGLMIDPGEPGVAFQAHAGGFVAGMFLVGPFRRQGIRMFNRARVRSR
ncbi:MAG: rhomboid family intramembrane serine protease [Aquisalimonadaceae bacterium]